MLFVGLALESSSQYLLPHTLQIMVQEKYGEDLPQVFRVLATRYSILNDVNHAGQSPLVEQSTAPDGHGFLSRWFLERLTKIAQLDVTIVIGFNYIPATVQTPDRRT